MSDSVFVIGLVVLKYYIPMQRETRAQTLCSAIRTVNVHKESNIMGVMEHLLHVGDA